MHTEQLLRCCVQHLHDRRLERRSAPETREVRPWICDATGGLNHEHRRAQADPHSLMMFTTPYPSRGVRASTRRRSLPRTLPRKAHEAHPLRFHFRSLAWFSVNLLIFDNSKGREGSASALYRSLLVSIRETAPNVSSPGDARDLPCLQSSRLERTTLLDERPSG